MKRTRNIQLLVLLCLILPVELMSQDCNRHHIEGDCRFDLQRGYKSYSQSHSTRISPKDTVEMNVVFYGQKDYIISFCTHRKMYPVHFRIYDEQNGDLLYDNADDKYLEVLGLGFDVAKSVIIKVDVERPS